jgi:nitroreductase
MTDEAWGRLTATLEYQAEHFEETPALIVACSELRGVVARMKSTLGKQRDGFGVLGVRRTGTFVRNGRRMLDTGEAASIYPGVQNLLLMARALGLGATMTTWHVMFEQEFKAALGIPGHVHTFAVIPVGYPRGNFGTVSRKPVADAIHWQQW